MREDLAHPSGMCRDPVSFQDLNDLEGCRLGDGVAAERVDVLAGRLELFESIVHHDRRDGEPTSQPVRCPFSRTFARRSCASGWDKVKYEDLWARTDVRGVGTIIIRPEGSGGLTERRCA